MVTFEPTAQRDLPSHVDTAWKPLKTVFGLQQTDDKYQEIKQDINIRHTIKAVFSICLT